VSNHVAFFMLLTKVAHRYMTSFETST